MSPSTLSLLITFLTVFTAAIGGGIIAKKLKIPLVLGYIGGGLLVGNLFSRFVDHAILGIVSDVGVTLLLFTLGIEFSFHRMEHTMKTVFWAVIVQILAVFGILFPLLLFLGFSFLPSVFIAIAGTLSSTAIVVKILSEKGELETLPGEIAASWLIIQDLAVVPIMILLPVITTLFLGNTIFDETISLVVLSIGKALLFLGIIVIFGRGLITRLLNNAAAFGSREIFVIAVIGIVFLFSIGAYAFGLSAALGAFLAGLLIAETSQNHAIFAEIRPLRDVFVVIFFVTLGFTLPLSAVFLKLPVIVVLTVVVIAVKGTIIYGLCRFLGFHRKSAFAVGLLLTEMSEFGFVIAGLGNRIGVLSTEHTVILVAMTSLSLFISVPLISRLHTLSAFFFQTFGKIIPNFLPTHQELSHEREQYPMENHIILCGYGRVGRYIGRALEMAEIPFLVVDYNHATLVKLREKGIHVVYGDPAERDVLDFAQVDLARAIIIAIPDRHTQELVIAHAQTLNRRIKIICRSHHEEDQPHLKSLGVQHIVQPEFEAALSIVTRLLTDFGVPSEDIAGKVSRLKIEHGLG